MKKILNGLISSKTGNKKAKAKKVYTFAFCCLYDRYMRSEMIGGIFIPIFKKGQGEKI